MEKRRLDEQASTGDKSWREGPDFELSYIYSLTCTTTNFSLATLTADDILNSWPEAEVGRILRDYGEESNWWFLKEKIMKARKKGGLHFTRELVDLVRKTSAKSGVYVDFGTILVFSTIWSLDYGRQGWIKTATRVFQALRIAVNDELQTLQNGLYACFDCLSSGGRLAVISFHSLEDRIVKKTFLDVIEIEGEDDGEDYTSQKNDELGVRPVFDREISNLRLHMMIQEMFSFQLQEVFSVCSFGSRSEKGSEDERPQLVKLSNFFGEFIMGTSISDAHKIQEGSIIVLFNGSSDGRTDPDSLEFRRNTTDPTGENS
ncbi:hypothetical protein KSP40_PGU022093 [Platanthera guangdongensis]|uniref:Ribosomal RNA small subunit methyltransferase H n=1 Tax=Platanthera guangdongensis TaxID=2320717 RepID=A0ABR2MWW4_9ASPA